jgi:hypothetical protein
MDYVVEYGFLLLKENTVPVLLGLAAAILIILIWLVVLSCQGAGWRRKYYALMGQTTAHCLEERLKENKNLTENVLETLKEMEKWQASFEQRSPGYLQKIGMVRYNAFPEVGSDLSYSVAILDGKGDGVVLSGIYGRDETRSFAKPIKDGQSNYRLTQEEEKAILLALYKNN